MVGRFDKHHTKGGDKFMASSSQKTPNTVTSRIPPMTCSEIIHRLELLYPQMTPRDVARFGYLMLAHVGDRPVEDLRSEPFFSEVWNRVIASLNALSEQYEAACEEMQKYRTKEMTDFTAKDLQPILRTLRLQDRILDFYTGIE